MPSFAEYLSILLPTIGGLGIFMFGMKNMSEGVQTIAGPSLRRMISRVTDNRFLAVGTGTTFTLLVQSSSIATVIMVGLVNAGLMKLHQAVGFIMGANIGTTITGWILIFQIGKYGLPLVGISALFYVFSRNDRIKFMAMAAMGLGMVFFGLQLMKDGVSPIKDMPGIPEMIQSLSVETYFSLLLCVLAGCILTVLVQSSSAALGILVAAAVSGLVPFPVAAAFILGENIGTTITVVLASLGATRTAKRAAYAHVLFNVIGVCWMVIAFPLVIRIVSWAIEWFYGVNPMTMAYADFENKGEYAVIITASIATMHTSFNVTNTAVFLPFIKPFTRLLERLVPVQKVTEKHQLRLFDAGSYASPVLGAEQSRRELIQMGKLSLELMDFVHRYCYSGKVDVADFNKVVHREETLDNIEREIIVFLSEVLQSTVPRNVVEEGRAQLRLAHEFESIGDTLLAITKSAKMVHESGDDGPVDLLKEVEPIHQRIRKFLERAVNSLENNTLVPNEEVKQESKSINAELAELRDQQISTVVEKEIDANFTLNFTGMLTNYRRTRAHILNAYQAMNGAKADLQD
ncbi:MAG TPA: Na/Pi cotransporter family protein [Pirellulaceae bacterium]|nr:Na/Pi cotransporter family protein [Pirellulaceae bacterium]HMO91196.1 Na/Pi cotransporter family protein [Pirellulaceae bacterium]HMP69034.1 Na/Pi cotransporter family protein [Pirellulaceae bacterium]